MKKAKKQGGLEDCCKSVWGKGVIEEKNMKWTSVTISTIRIHLKKKDCHKSNVLWLEL